MEIHRKTVTHYHVPSKLSTGALTKIASIFSSPHILAKFYDRQLIGVHNTQDYIEGYQHKYTIKNEITVINKIIDEMGLFTWPKSKIFALYAFYKLFPREFYGSVSRSSNMSRKKVIEELRNSEPWMDIRLVLLNDTFSTLSKPRNILDELQVILKESAKEIS